MRKEFSCFWFCLVTKEKEQEGRRMTVKFLSLLKHKWIINFFISVICHFYSVWHSLHFVHSFIPFLCLLLSLAIHFLTISLLQLFFPSEMSVSFSFLEERLFSCDDDEIVMVGVDNTQLKEREREKREEQEGRMDDEKWNKKGERE